MEFRPFRQHSGVSPAATTGSLARHLTSPFHHSPIFLSSTSATASSGNPDRRMESRICRSTETASLHASLVLCVISPVAANPSNSAQTSEPFILFMIEIAPKFRRFAPGHAQKTFTATEAKDHIGENPRRVWGKVVFARYGDSSHGNPTFLLAGAGQETKKRLHPLACKYEKRDHSIRIGEALSVTG